MKRLPIVFCFLLLAASAAAAPQAAYYYPCGIQAGTTNRIVVGGQGMWGLKGGWVSGEGVEVLAVVKVPGFPTQGGGEGEVAWVSSWLDGVWIGKKSKPLLPSFKALRTWRRCPWWDTLDERDPVELSIIARDIYVRKNPLQTSPALSQLVILDVAARPDAKIGLRDIVLYAGDGVTAPHPFFVTAEPHAAEQFFAPPSRVKEDERIFDPPVVLDGQIMPGETDSFQLNLPKGRRFVCSLVGRELQPYIGDAVPGFFNPVLRLVDVEGHVVAVADDFHYLPDPVLVCDIPADGVYRLEVHDNLFRGRADFVYAATCLVDDGEKPLPTPQERAFACYPPPASHVPSREDDPSARVFTGRIDFPGRSVSHDFEVAAPGEYSFELFARRRGSPLDGVVKLYGPVTFLPQSMTPLLAVWDDVTNKFHAGSVPQAESDPSGRWKFTAPGKYRFTVSDSGGFGGPDFDYVLRVAPAEPSFAAYAMKSSFVLRPGGGASVSFKVSVVRSGGFAGPVKFEGGDGFSFVKGEVPAGADEAEVTVVLDGTASPGMRVAHFTASAEVTPGRTLKVPLVPTDEAQQAFAYTHHLPVRGFHFFTPKNEPPVTEMPEWIPMLADKLFPRRIVLPTAELPKKVNAAALDAVCDVDTVPIVSIPADASDGVLSVKFGSSAAHLQNVREVVAREPENGKVDAAACARAVVAGVTRLVAGGLRHADGDPLRVRTFARATVTPSDNDMLVYVPGDDPLPLSGAVGAVARRLLNDGWCFDFVTDKTFPAMAGRSRYRAVYVPKLKKPMPDETFAKMSAAAEKAGLVLLFEDALPPAAKTAGFAVRGSKGQTFKHGRGKVAVGPAAYLLGDAGAGRAVRREPFAALGPLRFARFGGGSRDAWYFVHNPTKRVISGDWRFALNRNPRMVVAMDVGSGRIDTLPSKGKGSFAYSLAGGASVWLCVTSRDLTAPKRNEGGRPGHGGGRACNSCHDAPVKR
jgi:hypothetical protein